MCWTSPVRTPKYNSLWTAIDRTMLDPTKKDTPCPRAKEKPQQDGRRGKILSRIKPHTCQRYSEGSNKTLCDQEIPQRLTRPAFECLSISCGGTGQKLPATGAGALAAADLEGAVCGPSPLGGDCHHLHQWDTEQTTHKLQKNYTKEILTLLGKF